MGNGSFTWMIILNIQNNIDLSIYHPLVLERMGDFIFKICDNSHDKNKKNKKNIKFILYMGYGWRS